VSESRKTMNAGVPVPGGIRTPGAGLVGSGARTSGSPVPRLAVSAAGRFDDAGDVVVPFAPAATVVGDVALGTLVADVLAAPAALSTGDDTAAVSRTAAVSECCCEDPQPAAAIAAAAVIVTTGARFTAYPA
jgi:hypothetical protein